MQAAPPGIAAASGGNSGKEGWFIPGAEYALRPAEERPPETRSWIPDSAYFIDPIDTSRRNRADSGEQSARQTAAMTDTAESGAAEPDAAGTPWREPAFGAPLIGSLEHGKHYIQLGAYARAESVKEEITRLAKTYPVAVQNAGSADKPLYRVLVGPVSGGESRALLQRFKGGGYRDAFIRSGS
jgi:cell division septation protein DedD